mmetsp:Transcript_8285/g.12633  ORF Transcript_8285/g.12633 Transcript_8285/m.12633 type:complete len:2241 (-) Transcript_8285:2023-8745(-)
MNNHLDKMNKNIRRSEPYVDFEPPKWWSPWSKKAGLIEQTICTVEKCGDLPFMTWLDERGREAGTYTFAGLWLAAEKIAERMEKEWNAKPGDRIILCYLPGMAFMVAYWACLRLRCIAVPAYPPDPNKLHIGLKKLDLVKKSCDAKLCLTEKTLDQMRIALSLTHAWPRDLAWHRTDDKPMYTAGSTWQQKIQASAQNLIHPHEDDISFLQYTSGSTGEPKGVMLSFGNVWHNINEVYLPGQLHELERRGVPWRDRQVIGSSWLPQFHDTGLVLCTVAPFVAGYRMINFSPLTFLRSPLLWLEALGKYRVDWTAAPDFSYELCVRRVEEEVNAALHDQSQQKSNGSRSCEAARIKAVSKFNDLSCVKILACGAGERCRPVQLARFLEAFCDRCNLSREVFVPNYGLAEHVVATSGCTRGIILSRARDDLACCGEDFQIDLRIVNPSTRVEQPPGKPGEIWISSHSVAHGYWGKPQLSIEIFQARLAKPDGNDSTQCYMRTGDEGYLERDVNTDQLMMFVCGRLKDLIIVGGKNYFPEDIEVAAQEADRSAIRPGCVAAFANAEGGKADADEQVTCVFEIRAKALAVVDDPVSYLSNLTASVKTKVGIDAGLMPARIVVIAERTIPKTTSGKVQRRHTRALLDSNGLDKCLYDSAGIHPVTLIKRNLSQKALDWLAQSFDDALKWSGVAGSKKKEDEPDTHKNNQNENTPIVVNNPDKNILVNKKMDEHYTRTMNVLLKAVNEVAASKATPETAFHELGLSSRQTVELLRRVERDLNIELSPTLVFSCPTIATLAAEVCRIERGEDEYDLSPKNGIRKSDSANEMHSSIVSLACRLPGGCEDLGTLRFLVNSGIDTASSVPLSRWSDEYMDFVTSAQARERASYGAFCYGDEGFEPSVYGMRLSEAAALDPQQRMFLDRAYAALRAAGYDDTATPVARTISINGAWSASSTNTMKSLRGSSVAVCLGMMNMDAAYSIKPTEVSPHDLTGNGYSAAGSRLSFLFDLKGPALVVDTACSSALVAAHQAANFVSSGQAEAALFGGTSLMLAPGFVHVGAAVAGMTSSSGRCHTFDQAADGYCRGEGCAVAVLLPANGEENESSYIQVTGVRVQHNGQSATFTALNSSSQTRLIQETKGASSAIGVEAHGTGTRLGDPIELSGLAAVAARSSQKLKRIAGIKAILGHTEPTAGAAGLLAACISLLDDTAQANAALQVSNPVAGLSSQSELRLTPLVEAAPLCGTTRGVSSFGYSGIIAHCALQAIGCLSEEKNNAAESQLIQIVRARAPGEIVANRNLGLSRRLNLSPRHPRLATTWADDMKQRVRVIGSYMSSTHLLETAIAACIAFGCTGLTEVKIEISLHEPWLCIFDEETCRIEDRLGNTLFFAYTMEDDFKFSKLDSTACTIVIRSPGDASARETAIETFRQRAGAGIEELDFAHIDTVVFAHTKIKTRGIRLHQSCRERLELADADGNIIFTLKGTSFRPRRVNPKEKSVYYKFGYNDNTLYPFTPSSKLFEQTNSKVLAVVCGTNAYVSKAILLEPDVLVLQHALLSKIAAKQLINLQNRKQVLILIGDVTTFATAPWPVLLGLPPDVSRKVVIFADEASPDAFESSCIWVTSSRNTAYRVAKERCRNGLSHAVILSSDATASSLKLAVGGGEIFWRTCAILVVQPQFDIISRLVRPGQQLSNEKKSFIVNRNKSRKKKKGPNRRELVSNIFSRIVGPIALERPFAELGIDSLQGTEIAQELSTALGHDIPPTIFIQATDLNELCSILKIDTLNDTIVQDKEDNPSIQEKVQTKVSSLPAGVKCAPASPDQELLFWMCREKPFFTWLPVTAVGELVGRIDVDALRRAIDAVVERHEALRSKLVRIDNDTTIMYVQGDKKKWPQLEVKQASSADEARSIAQTSHDEYTNDPFSRLFRALLIQFPGGGVLYVSTNHAVSDGLSHQILFLDIVSSYNNGGASLPPPERRYCAFLVYHAENDWTRYTDADAVAKQRVAYAEADRLPSSWPTKTAAVAETLFATGALLHSDQSLIVSSDLVSGLEKELKLNQISLPSAVLAAYGKVLDNLDNLNNTLTSSQRPRVVQYSHSGRIGHPELRHTYGQLATDMNIFLPANTNSKNFVSQVHNAVLEGLRLAAVPYALAYRDAGTCLPLPPQYNWYDRYGDVPTWSGLEATEIHIDQSSMRKKTFNIGALYLMALVQSDGTLLLKFFFNGHVYERSTIQRALDGIETVLRNIVDQRE